MQQNRSYRFLNLPFEFNVPVPEFKNTNHVMLPKHQIPQELIKFIHSHGLMIHWSEVFRKLPNDKQLRTLHLDGDEFDDHVKINFVVNNGNSRMRWFKTKPGIECKKFVTVVNTVYYYADEQDCDLLTEAKLIKPALINAGQLHDITGVELQPRYAFSFVPRWPNRKRLVWDEAVVLFKDYIEP